MQERIHRIGAGVIAILQPQARRLLGVCAALFVLMQPACSGNIHGSFAWAGNDDRGIEEPERSLLLTTEFRIGRDDLFFFDYETIWWIYQIRSGSYDESGFLAALYENNLTPDPVEVDLRRVPIQRDGCCDYIRQFYENLDPGRYLLKIAYDSQVVDQVEFTVIPPEGPGGIDAERARRQGTEDLSGDDFDDEYGPGDANRNEIETDDILRYSS